MRKQLSQFWNEIRDEQQILELLRSLLLLQAAFAIVWWLRLLHFTWHDKIVSAVPELSKFTPWLQIHVQGQKGIELPLQFGLLGCLVLGAWWLGRNALSQVEDFFRKKTLLIAANLALVCLIYVLFLLGPHQSSFNFFPWQLQFSFGFFFLFLFLFSTPIGVAHKYKWLGFAVIVIASIVSFAPFSLYNYSYIVEPALRYVQGQNFSEVVSQYDLLLPLSVAPFVAGHWDLNNYKLMMQVINTAFNLWVFYSLYKIVSKEVFLFAVFAFILAKFQLNLSDPYQVPQVSIFRLELWFPLYLIVRRFGLLSFWVLPYLLLILFLSKTFATIYAGLYLGFVVLRQLSGARRNSWKPIFLIGIVLGFAVVLAHFALNNERLGVYLQYQISFLLINSHSAYWLALPFFLFFAAQIFRQTGEEERIYDANSLLVFLCCGALVYFLGRSHENNLLNCALSLIFCSAIGLNYVVSRLRIGASIVLVLCAVVSGDIAQQVTNKVRSFQQYGLSPKMPFAAGDFSSLKGAPIYPEFFDGKSLYCFPNSSIELYFYHYKFGNYAKLPVTQFKTCNSLILDSDFGGYSNSLYRSGLLLKPMNTPEI